MFYGADIRIQGLRYFKRLLEELAASVRTRDEAYIQLFKDEVSDEDEPVDYVTGVFYVDDEDGELQLIWKLEKGKLVEDLQP